MAKHEPDSASKAWISKFGKTVLRSTRSAFSEQVPNIATTGSSIADATRNGYSTFQKTKTNINNQLNYIKNTKSGRSANSLLSDAFTDIQNGSFSLNKINNDIDNGSDFDYSFDDIDADAPEAITIKEDRKNTALIGRAVVEGNTATIRGMKTMSNTIAKATLKGSKSTADQLTNVTMFGINKIGSDINILHNDLYNINTNIGSMLTWQVNNLGLANRKAEEHYSKTENLLNVIGENVAGLKDQMTKMSNMSAKSPSNIFGGLDEFSLMSGFNLKDYGKFVKKNAMNNPIFSALSLAKTMTSMDDTPLVEKVLTNVISGTLFPKKTRESLEKLDNNFNRGIQNLLYGLGDKGNDYTNPVMQVIGSIFGMKRPNTNKINMGMFKKDAMSWNGIAQKTLVEVIPSYLAKIESAITKSDERFYDMNDGLFKKRSALEKSYTSKYQSKTEMSMADIADKIGNSMGGMNSKDIKDIQLQINSLVNGRINGKFKNDNEYRNKMSDSLSKTQMSSKDIRNTILDFEDSISDSIKELNNFTSSIQDEIKGSVYRNLFNDESTKNKNSARLNKETDIFNRRSIEEIARQETLRKQELDNKSKEEIKGKFRQKLDKKFGSYGIYNKLNSFFVDEDSRGRGSKRADAIDNIDGHMYDYFMNMQNALERGKFRSDKNNKSASKSIRNSSYFVNRRNNSQQPKMKTFNKLMTMNQREATSIKDSEKMMNEYGKMKSNSYSLSNHVNNTNAASSAATLKAEASINGIDNGNSTESAGLKSLIFGLYDTVLKPMVGGIFGKNGFIRNLFKDTAIEKKLKEWKDKLFNEKDGVFSGFTQKLKDAGDYIKYQFTGKGYTSRGGKSYPNTDNNVTDHLTNGYNHIFTNVMTYFFGDDWKNDDKYKKYFSWADFKGKRDRKKSKASSNINNESTSQNATGLLGNSGYNTDKDNVITTEDGSQIITPNKTKSKLKSGPLMLSDKLQNRFKTRVNKVSSKSRSNVFMLEDKQRQTEQTGLSVYDHAILNIADASTEVANDISEKGNELSTQVFGDRKEDGKLNEIVQSNMFSNMKKNFPKLITAGIIGAGVGALNSVSGVGILGSMFLPTGIIGGALAGMGIHLARKSDRFMKFVFGEKNDDGVKTGGLISQRMQDTMKKVAPAAIGGAALGVFKSLLGIGIEGHATNGASGFLLGQFLPGGIVGGAIIGTGLALLKNNEKFNKTIFGEKGEDNKRYGGIFSKGMNGVTKIFSKSMSFLKGGAKGLAAGAVTGATLSQFGLLGSMASFGGPIGMGAVGLGLGIANSTKRFNAFLFGEEELDADGNPTGKKIKNGLLHKVRNMLTSNVFEPVGNKIKDTMEDFAVWAKKKIEFPFRLAFGPILDSLYGIKDNVTDFVKDKFEVLTDGIAAMFKKGTDKLFGTVGKVLSPLGKMLISVFKLSVKSAASPITMPLKALSILTSPTRIKNTIAFGRNLGKGVSGLRKDWAEEDNANMRNGTYDNSIFGGIKRIKSRIGELKQGYQTAKDGWNEGQKSLGYNKLGWMDVNSENKNLKNQVKETSEQRKQRNQIDRLRNRFKKDDDYKEAYWSDERMDYMRDRFEKKGVSRDSLKSKQDIYDFLYDKNAWEDRQKKLKNGNPLFNPNETLEQKAAREAAEKSEQHLSDIQGTLSKFVNTFEEMYAAGYKNAYSKRKKKYNKHSNKQINKIRKSMGRSGLDPDDLNIENESDLLKYANVPGYMWDNYRGSKFYESGDIEGWYKQNEPNLSRTQEARAKQKTTDEMFKNAEAKMSGRSNTSGPTNSNTSVDEDIITPSKANVKYSNFNNYKNTNNTSHVVNDDIIDAVEGRDFRNSPMNSKLDTIIEQNDDNLKVQTAGQVDPNVNKRRKGQSLISNKIADNSVITEDEYTNIGKKSKETEETDDAQSLGTHKKKGKLLALVEALTSNSDKISNEDDGDTETKRKSVLGRLIDKAKGVLVKDDDKNSFFGNGGFSTLGIIGAIAGTGLLGVLGVGGISTLAKAFTHTKAYDYVKSFVSKNVFPLISSVGTFIGDHAPDFFKNITDGISTGIPIILNGIGKALPGLLSAGVDGIFKVLPSILSTAVSIGAQTVSNTFKAGLSLLSDTANRAGIGGSKTTKADAENIETKIADDGTQYKIDSTTGKIVNSLNDDGSGNVLSSNTYIDEKGNKKTVADSGLLHAALKTAVNPAARHAAIKTALAIPSGLTHIAAGSGKLASKFFKVIPGGGFASKAIIKGINVGEAKVLQKTDKLVTASFKTGTLKGGKASFKGLEKTGEILGKDGDGFVSKFIKNIVKKLDSLGNLITKKFGKLKWVSFVKDFSKDLIDKWGKSDNIIKKKIAGRVSTKVAKAAGKTVSTAATAGLIQIGFSVYDLVSGLFDADYLFGVNSDEVTTKMRLVSSIMKFLLGLGIGPYVDILIEIGSMVTGTDYKKQFATFIYKCISSDDEYKNLKADQEVLEIETDLYNQKNGTNLDVGSYKELKNKPWMKKFTNFLTGKTDNTDYEELETLAKKQMETQNKQKAEKAKYTSSAKVSNSSSTSSSGEDRSVIQQLLTALKGSNATTQWSSINSQVNPSGENVGNGAGAIGYGRAEAQGDPKWANFKLGKFSDGSTSTMATGGCGPTALSMVTQNIGNGKYNPLQIAKMAKSNGYLSDGGSNSKLFTSGARQLGLTPSQVSKDNLKSKLKSGSPVVLAGKSNGSGNTPYTQAGHIIYANGYDSKSGKAIISDPINGTTSTKNLNEITSGMTNGWSYSKNIGNGPANPAPVPGPAPKPQKIKETKSDNFNKKSNKFKETYFNNQLNKLYRDGELAKDDLIGFNSLLANRAGKNINKYNTHQVFNKFWAESSAAKYPDGSTMTNDELITYYKEGMSGYTEDELASKGVTFTKKFDDPVYYRKKSVKDLNNLYAYDNKLFTADYPFFYELYNKYCVGKTKYRNKDMIEAKDVAGGTVAEYQSNTLFQRAVLRGIVGKDGKANGYDHKNGFVFFQNKDKRWANIDWRGSKVGTHGSDLTSLAMISSAFGSNIIPPDYIYNNWLTKNPSWWSTSRGLMPEKVFADGGYNAMTATQPEEGKRVKVSSVKSLNSIKSALLQRKPVYMRGYKFAHSPFGGVADPKDVDVFDKQGMNSVVALYGNNDDFIVNDPSTKPGDYSSFSLNSLSTMVGKDKSKQAFDEAFVVTDPDGKGLSENLDLNAMKKPGSKFKDMNTGSILGNLLAFAENLGSVGYNFLNSKITGNKYVSIMADDTLENDKVDSTGIGVSTENQSNTGGEVNNSQNTNTAKPGAILKKSYSQYMSNILNPTKGLGFGIGSGSMDLNTIGFGKKKKKKKKASSGPKNINIDDVFNDTITKVGAISAGVIEKKLGGDYQLGKQNFIDTQNNLYNNIEGSNEFYTDGLVGKADSVEDTATVSKSILPNLNDTLIANLNKILPTAVVNYRKTGMLPSLTLGQAMIESTLGTKGIAANGARNNWYGHKESKVGDGVWTDSKGNRWDIYGSPARGAASHIGWFNRIDAYKQYRKRIYGAKTYADAATAIGASPYCADSSPYAANLISAIGNYHLNTWDDGRLTGIPQSVIKKYNLDDSDVGKGLGLFGRWFGSASTVNNFPYYTQGDARWGKNSYGYGTIGSAGCGPTSMAMVLVSYNVNVDPSYTAKWAYANGFRVESAGTAWGFFSAIAKKFGISVKQHNDIKSAYAALKRGIPVIASCHKGIFTKGGHFIVLSGIDKNGNIRVNDPNGANRPLMDKGFTPDTIAGEAKQYWEISKNGTGSIGAVLDISGRSYSSDDLKDLDVTSTGENTEANIQSMNSGTVGDRLDAFASNISGLAKSYISSKIGNGVGSSSTLDYLKDTTGGKVTSWYGNRNSTFGSEYHRGVDIGANAGTSIHSPVDGDVVQTGYDAAGYGNYTVIRDRDGNNHIFGHMNETAGYGIGSTISKNDTIGTIGSTGKSTGNHLHYEIRRNDNKYSTIDPSRFNINNLSNKKKESNESDNVYGIGSGGNHDLSSKEMIIKKLSVAVNTDNLEEKMDVIIDVIKSWAANDIKLSKSSNNKIIQTPQNNSRKVEKKRTAQEISKPTSKTPSLSANTKSLRSFHESIAKR